MLIAKVHMSTLGGNQQLMNTSGISIFWITLKPTSRTQSKKLPTLEQHNNQYKKDFQVQCTIKRQVLVYSVGKRFTSLTGWVVVWLTTMKASSKMELLKWESTSQKLKNLHGPSRPIRDMSRVQREKNRRRRVEVFKIKAFIPITISREILKSTEHLQ